MTPLATPLPSGLTSLDQSGPAKAMIQSARSALELAEAELAALELARAFEEHPRLRSIDIVAIDRDVSPFQNRARVERHYQAISDVEGASDLGRPSSWLEQSHEDPLSNALAEMFEYEAIRIAGSRLLAWLSAERLENLSGRTIQRPIFGSDGVALAMAFILSDAEFAHWQAQALASETAPKDARTSKSL